MSEPAPMGGDLSVRADVGALRARRQRSAEVRNAAMSAGLAFAAGGALAFGAPGAAAAHTLLASALPLATVVGLKANRGGEERSSAPPPVTWRAAILLTAAAVLVVAASDVGERNGVPLIWLASVCVTAFVLWPLRTSTSRPLLVTLVLVACLALFGFAWPQAPLGAAALCLGLAAWSDRGYRDADRHLAVHAGGASLDAFEVRLAELSRLTDQYAGLSEHGLGLGGVPVGLCWLGAGTALDLGAPRLGQVCLALAVPVLALGLRAARRFYQRHGVVRRPTDMGGSAPRPQYITFLLLIAVVVKLAAAIALQPLDPTGLSSLQLAVVWGTCLAIAAALEWVTRKRTHHLFELGGVAAISVGSPVPPWGVRDIAMLLFFGALWVTVGLLAHLLYWRLERRLAALRRTMP